MRIKSIILAPICAMLCVCSFAVQMESRAASSEADSEKDSSYYWERLIKDKLNEFKALKESVSLYMLMADAQIGLFEKSLEKDRVRFHQTKYMLEINEPNPFEFKMACFELYKQTSKFKSDLTEMEDLLRETSNYANIMDRSRNELAALLNLKEIKSNPESVAEISESLDIMGKFQKTLESIRDRSGKVVEPGRELLAERENCMSTLNDSILRNLKANLLKSSGPVYDYNFWLFMPHAFKRWFLRTPSFLLHKMPDNEKDWYVAGTSMFAVAALLWLILRRLLGRRIEICERLKEGSGRLLNWALALSSLGAGLMVAALSINMPKNILIFNLAVSLIAGAALCAGWGMKMISSATTSKLSPLQPLFLAYLYGIALQITNAPEICQTVIWPPAMAALAFLSMRMIKDQGNGLLKPQRVVCGFTVAMAAVSGGLSLLGLSLLAVVLMKSWFMLALSFQFASAISDSLQWHVLKRKETGYFARSFALGFAVPAIWLSIISGAMLWMAWQLINIQTSVDLAFHEFKLGDMQFSLATALLAAFLFFVVKTALKTLCESVAEKADGALLDPGVVTPFKTLISFTLWTVYGLAVLKILGLNLDHLGVILGGLSVGLGFGLQNFVNNLVSGMMLLFGRDIREGDIIQIGDTWAKIQKISLRSTLACTTDNAIISIPNSNMLSSQVTNWTLNNRHIRRDIKVPVAASADMGAVQRTLMDIADNAKGVMKLPAPEIFISSVAPSNVDMTLRIWVTDIEKSDHVLSDLNAKINARLMNGANGSNLAGAVGMPSSNKL